MTNIAAPEFIAQLNRTISAIENQHQHIIWMSHEIAASWKSEQIWTGLKVDKQLLLRMKTLEPTIIAQHLLGVLNVEKTLDIFNHACAYLEADLVVAITQLREATTASDNTAGVEKPTTDVDNTASNCFSEN